MIADPPLFEGAAHDADQSKLVPLSAEEAVNEVTVPGTVGEETDAVFEKACVDPPAFVAVTRQRIGLVKNEKKFDGGA